MLLFCVIVKKIAKKRAEELLDEVGLSDVAGKKVAGERAVANLRHEREQEGV